MTYDLVAFLSGGFLRGAFDRIPKGEMLVNEAWLKDNSG